MSEIPRRSRLYEFTPAEKAIWDALQAVEAVGADPRLTDAVQLLGYARECVADYVDGVPRRGHWTEIHEKYPDPHARYMVRRGDLIFTATPCYGMHSPWWVPMLIDGSEGSPVNMREDDYWKPLVDVRP